MSKRVKNHLPVLRALVSLRPQERKSFLCHSSDDFILTLCEIALNVLKGNIPLSKAQYNKLKKQKRLIKLFADKKVSLKRKRQSINQSGGFLGTLLSVAIPVISGLLAARKS